ncbi:MAG: aromatic-ring-hydroxylating dioxygenase subunit beta [Burkholderiaceae bacterium]
MAITQPDNAQVSESELARFIAYENQLLDDGRYEQWLGLFCDDGHYWLPLSTDQHDPVQAPSLAYEDTLTLSVKVKRLSHPQAHSQQPPSRCLHVLQASRLLEPPIEGVPGWQLRTPLSYFEQRGESQIQLAGVATHHLITIDGTLRIKLKRVDLLEAATALPMIQLFP